MCKLEAKSLFGELSLLFKGKRTANVISNDFCSILVIPNAAFRKYMKTLLLRKLSVTINFYKSLSFMDNLPMNVILILASKTELQKFSKDTLICMQGSKSSSLYFIKYGRVKILRNVDFVEPQTEPNIHDFEDQYKSPTDEERKVDGLITQRQLEITELTNSECFGEDHGALTSGFNDVPGLIEYKLPYTAISAVPLDVYVIKKRYMYFYLDDIAK